MPHPDDAHGLMIEVARLQRARDEALARERGQMVAVLHTIGGEVEGHPTSAIDYLQRLRALVAIEEALQAAVNYSAYSGDPDHVPSCDSTVYSRKPCDCWMPQARAALAGTVTVSAAESERDALRAEIADWHAVEAECGAVDCHCGCHVHAQELAALASGGDRG